MTIAPFEDVYLPESIIGYGFKGTPKTNTQINVSSSGGERRNQNWVQPLRTFSLPEGVRCNEDVFALLDMFLALDGPLFSFAFRDPLDFATTRLSYPNIEPITFRTDQPIGIGNGSQTTFQLQKRYTYGTKVKERPVYHPVLDSVQIGMNALDPSSHDIPGGPYTYTVSRLTGEVVISPAPNLDVIITWGGLFDVEVRFEADDSLDLIVESFKQTGFADLTLLEVRPC